MEVTQQARLLTVGVELEMLAPSERPTETFARALGGRVVEEGDDADPKADLRVTSPFGEWRSVRETSLEVTPEHPCGREFVSPVLRWGDPRERARPAAVLRALKRAGFAVNESCGLHVHVGALGRSHHPLFILSTLALSFEWSRLIHAFFLDRRLQSQFAEAHTSWNLAQYAAFFTGEREATYVDVMRLALDQDPSQVGPLTDKRALPRNFGVNLSALPRHGTIEYRFFEGTMDPDVLLACVELSVRFTARAMLTRYPVLRPVRAPTIENAEVLLDDLEVTEPARSLLLSPAAREYMRNLSRPRAIPFPAVDLSLLGHEARRLSETLIRACRSPHEPV